MYILSRHRGICHSFSACIATLIPLAFLFFSFNDPAAPLITLAMPLERFRQDTK